MRKPNTFTFAQREADQEPDIVSGQEPNGVACHDSDSGADPDPVSGYEPDSVPGREPESVADQVPLDGHLPEQAVAVGLNDVRHRHRHIPVRRALCADPHLDDV